MPGKLLNLTFHQPDALTGEDLRFKAGALKSMLVDGDVMDEVGAGDGPKPFLANNIDLLTPTKKKLSFGGLQTATLVDGSTTTSLISMNGIGEKTWGGRGYISTPDPANPRRPFPSVFENWLLRVFATPAQVVVFGGHHTGDEAKQEFVWGAELEGHTRIFTGFAPRMQDGEPLLVFRGYRPGKRDAEDLAGPFPMKDALKDCRLLVLLGCNGATKMIKPWRDAIKAASGGRAPFILGWYLTHKMPRDRKKQFFSTDFWTRLATLAPGTTGSKNLDFLHQASFRDRIVELWRDVMKANFKPTKPDKEDQSHLFFDEVNQRGAGAVDPDGKIFHVVDKNGTIQPKGTIS